MTDINVPSTNPANLGTLSGLMREVLTKFLQNTDDMLPARVVSYDRETRRAKVQPLIMIVKTDQTVLGRAPIASVPVMHLGGGGFVLDFNLNPGDLGWIKANDRDISLFLQAYNQTPPNTYRKHSFEDALFIPDVMHGYTIAEEDAQNAVLQSTDGTQRVSIWPDRVKMTSGSSSITITDDEVIIDTPTLTFTGDFIGTAARADGNGVFAGTLKSAIDVLGGSSEISLVHHIHSGVQTGGGNTGEPVP